LNRLVVRFVILVRKISGRIHLEVGTLLAKFLFRLARHRSVGAVVGLGFQYGAGLLPVRRLLETDRVIAFHHPRPAWERHILLVPKRRIRSLVDLAAPHHHRYFDEMLSAARQIVDQLGLRRQGYALCANGGPRQEVQQVHVHLFTGERYVSDQPVAIPVAESPYRDEGCVAYLHPAPEWESHLLLQPVDGRPGSAILAALPLVVRTLGLEAKGYTLVMQSGPGDVESPAPLFHLIGGRRTT
jgi:histidine triad (HIT) family protein